MIIDRRSLMAGLATLVGGCSPVAVLNTTVSRKGFTRETNIPYGTHPRQKFDVYVPDAPRSDGKAVVFFYGGSWDSGSKDDYLFVGQALAARGTTTIIPDYRIYPDVRYPTFLEDAAQAVKSATERIDTAKLYVTGHSAGAYIALMLAANTPYLATAGVDRMKLPGVVGISGPYDFLPLTSRRLQEIFGGRDRRETQPITYAKAPLPPALFVHGTADTTVLPFNSVRMAAAWRAAGGVADLKLYPGVDHVDTVAAFSELLRSRAPTLQDMLAFIEQS